MRKFNKVLILVTLMFMMTTSCFAATKEELLAYFKQTHVVSGKSITLDAAQITKIENYLNQNEVSEQNADKIIADANEVISYMTRNNVSDPSKLSASQKEYVMGVVEDAGTAAGVSVTFDKATNEMQIYKDGKLLETTSFTNTIPFTGTNVMPYITVGVGFILIAAFAIIMKNNKKGLVNA